MARSDAQKRADKKYEAKRRGKRHKVWMGIFYEDSCPNWRDYFAELTFPCCVSPLHDADVWTAADEEKDPSHKAGKLKEPHRHFLCEYPVQQSYEDVCEDFSFIPVVRLKFVKSLGSMARYLTHEGTPSKAQYSRDGVLEFGAAIYSDWCSQSEDLHGQMKLMREFIRENNITEFVDFQDWCDENDDEWSRLLDLHCSWAIGNYIERYRGKIQDAMRKSKIALDDSECQ